MRSKEIANIYECPISKKEIVEKGKELIASAMDAGEVSAHELMAIVCRLKEFINSADAELRQHIPAEPYTGYGVTFTPVAGGETVDYKNDPVWMELKAAVSHREELLKLANKSKDSIYDSEGIEVPKVGTTPRKSSITLKF